MARLNVYLPDDLAAAAKEAGLNLSAVTQDAVRQALAARSTNTWLATLTHRYGVAHTESLAALDEARDEPSTHHA